MSLASPILPAQHTMAHSSNPAGVSIASQLPPISALAGSSRMPHSTHPADGTSTEQLRRGRAFSGSQYPHLQRPHSDRYSDYPEHDGMPEQYPEREVAPPSWTRHYAGRAPPPKPLRAPSVGPPSTMRRHHPYNGQHSVAAPTPSPTWPQHIGIEEGRTARVQDNTPSVLRAPTGRGRAATVLIPRGDETAAAGYPARPHFSARTQSSNLFPERSPTFLQEGQKVHYGGDSRRGSYATTGSGSDQPHSPLLFAPLSNHSDPHAMHHHYQHQHQPQPQHEAAKHIDRPMSLTVPPPQPYRSTGITPLITDRLTMWEDSSPHGSFFQYSPREPSRPFSAVEARSPYASSPSLRGEEWSRWDARDQPSLERMPQSRKRRRPPYSYSSLIAQAIASSPNGRMTLREIYIWISKSYPELYSMDGADSQGWQNTVRHNLSLNKSFVKVARTAQDVYDSCSNANAAQTQAARGKGGWWTIDPVVAAAQLGPHYRGLASNGGHSGETSPETPQGELTSMHRPRSADLQHLQGRKDSLSGSSEEEPESPPARIPSVLIKDPANVRVMSARSDAVSPTVPTSSSFRPGIDVPSVLARPRPTSYTDTEFVHGPYNQPAPSTSPSNFSSSLGSSNPGLGFGFRIPPAVPANSSNIPSRPRGYTTSSSRELRPVASVASLSSTANARLLPGGYGQRSVSGGHIETTSSSTSKMDFGGKDAPRSAPLPTTEKKDIDGDSDMSSEVSETHDVKESESKEEAQSEQKTGRMSIKGLLC